MMKIKDSPEERAIPHFWFTVKKLLYLLYQRWLYQLYQWKAIWLRKVSWSAVDQEIKRDFLNHSVCDEDRYTKLFSYLVSGFLFYSSSEYSHIYYPGAISNHGADVDAMEGFSRLLPMISAWIRSGRPFVIQGFDGQYVNLLEIARRGLLVGTNPRSKGYWGQIVDDDQRIVEAADIALSLWLLRDHIWLQLSTPEKEMISKWLLSVNGKSIPDNNWHLFPVIVNEVLTSLGCVGDRMSSHLHYTRMKSFYQGNGWFSDGPEGNIDFYNAWAFHYALFWINLINPTLDSNFINSSLNDFVRNYKYFFSTEGLPITGRSICCRMAAPAPLIAATITGAGNITPGLARKTLGCVWEYFIDKGAISRGRITQGYWKEDFSLLDDYSGPGSSMWSTRSLTLAFFNPPGSNFWTAQWEDLPIEKESYSILIPEIQWEIRGSKHTHEVKIIKLSNTDDILTTAKKPSLPRRVLVYFLGLPYRSRISQHRYELYTYSSRYPFWLGESQESENK